MQSGGFIPHQQGVPGMQNLPTPGQGPMNRGPSGPPPQISGKITCLIASKSNILRSLTS